MPQKQSYLQLQNQILNLDHPSAESGYCQQSQQSEAPLKLERDIWYMTGDLQHKLFTEPNILLYLKPAEGNKAEEEDKEILQSIFKDDFITSFIVLGLRLWARTWYCTCHHEHNPNV